MWTAETGVSGTVGLICLVAAALMWTVGKRHTPRLIVALLITGVVGILGTPVGGWLRRAVGWVDTMTGTVTGRLTGTVVVGLVAAIALYVLVVHVGIRKKVTDKTLIAATVVPVSISTVPGPIGDVTTWVLGALTGAVGWAVSAAFGWN